MLRVKLLRDFEGRAIRLTDERLVHILERPEMAALEPELETTLRSPQNVIQSISDDDSRLYYRFYTGTKVGDKYLCVVVKILPVDAFIITAYLTDKVKKGDQLWPRND